MGINQELIEKLPKTDLHCHLDGSIRCDTLIDLAKQYGVKLLSYEKETLMAKMGYGRVRKNLEEYLLGFEPILAVMQTKEALERVFYEVCEDAYLENVWHIEIRYCPYLHTNKGLSIKEVVESLLKASKKASENFGISVGHILSGLKNDPEHSILEVAKLACEYLKKGIVGFDLAGPEAGFPISDHLAAIYYAKKHHMFITLHAGESFGPESISQAIHKAGAHRIGHGTSLIKDLNLLNYVIDHRIGIEACPTSNWHTGAIKSLLEHPIKQMLEMDARVSVNTDNRLCSDTSITEELLGLIENLGFTLEQIRRTLENGFKSAFLPYNVRAKMLNEFNVEFKKLTSDSIS